MHPVQAAPRQRAYQPSLLFVDDDAPRAGSAEAKTAYEQAHEAKYGMHPVQAAPRQRLSEPTYYNKDFRDAPRAGSAEAKPTWTAA